MVKRMLMLMSIITVTIFIRLIQATLVFNQRVMATKNLNMGLQSWSKMKMEKAASAGVPVDLSSL